MPFIIKILLAKLLRTAFKLQCLKHFYFGIHKHLLQPRHWFKNVVLKSEWKTFDLELKLDDWIQQNLYFLGEYEESELKVIQTLLKPNHVFLDVGANIGLFSLVASQQIGDQGKIIAFEPFSTNYKQLQKHISGNAIQNILAEQLAVGDKSGQVNLHYHPKHKNLGMVSTNPKLGTVQEEVNLISLDDYVNQNKIKRVDLVKIDVEHAELSVLQGMQNILAKHTPDLLIEVLDNESTSIDAFLNQFNYQKFWIGKKGQLSTKTLNPTRKNFVYRASQL